MKVAILSESAADDAALRILIEGILSDPVELYSPPLRTRGWPGICDNAPSVLKHLHYHTDTDALVFVADSNMSARHSGGADVECEGRDCCRLCVMRKAIDVAQAGLSLVPERKPVKVAFGLAVPAMEAWYLHGLKPGVTEEAWYRGMASGKFPYTKNQLKREVYGTDRPGLSLETQRAEEACRRLVKELGRLEASFPFGFGALVRGMRSWA